MTSKKVMFSRSVIALFGVALSAALSACGPKIHKPQAFPSPYPLPKLWAVVPPRNESATTLVDTAHFADHLVQQLTLVQDIDVLPVNRTLDAMAGAQIAEVTSPGQIMTLMNLLKVDGLIISSVTAWDPYNPPKIGASLQLYIRTVDPESENVGTRELTRSATDRILPGVREFDQPVSHINLYLDASNGDVLARLIDYGKSRTGIDNPDGWRAYLLNMDLYNEFAAHELVRQLLSSEWDRLHPVAPENPGDFDLKP